MKTGRRAAHFGDRRCRMGTTRITSVIGTIAGFKGRSHRNEIE